MIHEVAGSKCFFLETGDKLDEIHYLLMNKNFPFFPAVNDLLVKLQFQTYTFQSQTLAFMSHRLKKDNRPFLINGFYQSKQLFHSSSLQSFTLISTMIISSIPAFINIFGNRKIMVEKINYIHNLPL